MTTTMFNKLKIGALSLSAVALLAACGDSTDPVEQPVEEPAVEEPAGEQPVDDTITEETDPADDTATEEPATDGSGAVDTTNGIYNVEFPISMDQAVQIFNETFGENVNIDSIELDEDVRGYEYGISGWDDEQEYDLEIDAHSGEVTEQETDRDNDNDEIINMDNVMTPQEAMKIAVEDAGVDFVESWTLEFDDGLTVYEIDLQGADDLTINAETGDIVDR